MPAGDLNVDIQGDWNAYPLREQWPMTPDNVYIFGRLADAPVEATAAEAHGRLLEVAAAEAVHACRLSKLGLEAFVLEPSPTMLAAARKRMAEHGATLHLVRGIAETLPFPDESFDRVLCDSALDHLADPERGIREMARVTRPDGRVVLTFVNYGGLTVRASRAVYRVGRAIGLLPPESQDKKLFWDTPVPFEHTFECTFANVSAMCRPYLELDRAYGVSLGWMFPGWGRLLARVGYPRRLLGRLDALAHDRPGIADFVVSIWRPRPRAEWPTEAYRVRESNPVYQQMRGAEARYWETANFDAFFAPTNQATAAARNRDYTGNPERTWMDDLVARGPFRDVAVLGCDDEDYAGAWLRAGGSERLTVYELSPGVIAKARDRLGPLAVRVGFVSTDLNFVELPAGAYDCIWSSGVLHFVTNLEHLFAQVDRALRPGGVFAFQCYVGEPRLQYAPARLAKMNAVLETVPARYRRKDRIVPPEAPWHLSPFQAVRPRDIVPLASARFEPVHLGFGGRFFPLALMLDMPALVREAPEVVARLEQADAAAASDLDMQPTAVYAVFRKRG